MQKILSYFANNRVIAGEIPKIWNASDVSIFDFLSGRDPEEIFWDVRLPDDEKVSGPGEMRWAPGAFDGAFGHHGGSGGINAEGVFSALQRACKSLTGNNLRSLYDSLMKVHALENADSLISMIGETSSLNTDALFRIAVWLATQSPDREPVKFGIVLLGIFEVPSPPLDVLMTLGRHDEFSLYVAIALHRVLPDSQLDRVLYLLAKQVYGWGRVQIVERLAETSDPEIKNWMLREGYKNGVMTEYLAYTCAVAGGLVDALRQEAPDDALLKGAGDILTALISGGPAEDMSNYEDGPEATLLFVQHMQHRAASDLENFTSLHAIKSFVEDEAYDWGDVENFGWTPSFRQNISSIVAPIMEKPEWLVLINQGLAAADDSAFFVASTAAWHLRLDTWKHRFERQKANSDRSEWYYLMQTEDSGRISRTLDLAQQQLNLDDLTAGPALENGLGPKFKEHGALEAVIQGLGQFPKMGEEFLGAGLQSPVIRSRNAVIRTLNSWGRENWSSGLIEALEASISKEPDEAVRERLGQLLSGNQVQ